MGILVNGILNLNQLTFKTRQIIVSLMIFIGIISNSVLLLPHLKKTYPNTLMLSTSHDLWKDYQSVFNIIKQSTPHQARFYTDNQDDSYFDALNTDRLFLDIFLFLPTAQLTSLCPST